MTLRIVTDSTADLPPEFVERLNITVVPLVVLFGDEELVDGVDIQSDQFFRRLERDPAHPTTAQPAPALDMPADRTRELRPTGADLGTNFAPVNALAEENRFAYSFLGGRFETLDEFKRAGREKLLDCFAYKPAKV